MCSYFILLLLIKNWVKKLDSCYTYARQTCTVFLKTKATESALVNLVCLHSVLAKCNEESFCCCFEFVFRYHHDGFLKKCNAKNKRYDVSELHLSTIFFAHNNVLSRDVFFQNKRAEAFYLPNFGATRRTNEWFFLLGRFNRYAIV